MRIWDIRLFFNRTFFWKFAAWKRKRMRNNFFDPVLRRLFWIKFPVRQLLHFLEDRMTSMTAMPAVNVLHQAKTPSTPPPPLQGSLHLHLRLGTRWGRTQFAHVPLSGKAFNCYICDTHQAHASKKKKERRGEARDPRAPRASASSAWLLILPVAGYTIRRLSGKTGSNVRQWTIAGWDLDKRSCCGKYQLLEVGKDNQTVVLGGVLVYFSSNNDHHHQLLQNDCWKPVTSFGRYLVLVLFSRLTFDFSALIFNFAFLSSGNAFSFSHISTVVDTRSLVRIYSSLLESAASPPSGACAGFRLVIFT